MVVVLLLGFLSFLVAGLGTWILLHIGERFTRLDHPNKRSLHTLPTPQGGGVAILAALWVTWPWVLSNTKIPTGLPWLIVGGMLVAGVSWLDDHRSLGPLIRIGVQSLAAILLLFSGLVPTPFDLFALGSFYLGGVGWILSFLFLLWMMNLYNFMDGMDGFAGGMGAFGFLALSWCGFCGANEAYGLLTLAVAMANLGFLLWNFPPARIFMGDTGAVSMGFLVGAFAFWGVQEHLFPTWFPLLVFSPFIIDASVTLLTRLFRRERIWEAHCQHYYQRLVCLGWTHRRTVLLEYLLMAATSGSGLLLVDATPVVQALGLALWMLLYFLLGLKVCQLERCKGSSL